MGFKLPRKLGWVLVAVGVWLALRQFFSIARLYRSGDKLRLTKEEINELSLKEKALETQLKEIDSPEFVERQLRDKLGYGRPGETILILPKQDASSNTQITNNKSEEPNWRKWWNLYIRL